MNSLNSVLLEGHLTTDPILARGADGRPTLSFSVESTRTLGGPEARQEKLTFPVRVHGNQAEAWFYRLSEGRGVRVVGRLAQSSGPDGTTPYIVGENIEFKPHMAVATSDIPVPAIV